MITSQQFSHERLKVVTTLAADQFWHSSPDDSGLANRIYDFSLTLYPGLDAHEESARQRANGRLKPYFLPAALVEIGQGAEAIEYVKAGLLAFPADFPFEQDRFDSLQNTLALIANSSAMAMERLGANWNQSPHRSGLAYLLREGLGIGPLEEGSAYASLLQNSLELPYLAKSLWEADDLDLLRDVFQRMTDERKGIVIRQISDPLKPVKAGDLELQMQVLRAAYDARQAIGANALSLLTLKLWNGYGELVTALANNGEPGTWREACDLVLHTFNVASVSDQKRQLSTMKLWELLSGAPSLLANAKAAGLELNEADYRRALEPLEVVSKLAKNMQWVSPMGASYAKLQAAIATLFEGEEPQAIFKKNLPKDLAGALSEITGDTSFKAKAKVADQGQIFVYELGV